MMRLIGFGTVLVLAAAAAAESPAERCAAAARADLGNCAAAVAEAPDDPGLRRLFAISLARTGQYERAVAQYREVTRLAPADGRAYYEHAWMLAFLRRYAEAIEPIERSISLQPEHVPSYRAAAIIYDLVKRPEDLFRVAFAGAKLGDVIAMYDTHVCFAKGRGTARDEAQALVWLTRAAEAGHVTAMDELAQLYLNGGLGARPDPRRAEDWATRARKERLGGKL